MAYRIGIDAGSKTIKVAVIDADNKLVYSMYRRHQANIRTTVDAVLHDLTWRYGNITGSVAITGSAGIELAELLHLPFVQEVIATTKAVQTLIPEADAIIELGGEDAKVVYLGENPEQRMNATCAGGTGGFIDTIAFMLGVRSKEMSNLAMGATKIYPIASRCAVFAQTDIRPLLNSGAKKADIAASALEAVVKQTIGGLACGRPLTGKIVFLGGPLQHIPDLVFRFRKTLNLKRNEGIKPPDAHLYTAIGAALSSAEPESTSCQVAYFSLEELQEKLAEAPASKNDLPTLPPLFSCRAELDDFKARHLLSKTARKPISHARGSLYLGIDAGSTTIKLSLIDADQALVYSDYQPTKGDILQTATAMLAKMYATLPREYGGEEIAHVAHATITGYGEELLRAAFNADSGTVETFAHLNAAQTLFPEVDFMLDIGGQDMKAIWVENGSISNTVLNEACSSGCGSFLEGTAYSLKLNPHRFTEIALRARRPVDLGTKCTVFMTSRVRHAQKLGVSHDDIAAGLAYSVVENALFKTIGMQNLDELGETVVVQGGTFMSDAVLRAFELVSGKQVIRPDIAHLMGAFGAALIAQHRAAESEQTTSSLVSRDALSALGKEKHFRRCEGCSNSCLLNIYEFAADRILISGNNCSKALDLYAGTKGSHGLGNPSRSVDPPNLYRLEQKLLSRYQNNFSAHSSAPRQNQCIGIPFALHNVENLPFWYTLFDQLGFKVVVSSSSTKTSSAPTSAPHTSRNLLASMSPAALTKGYETLPSESVCYPAKLSHLHVAQLREMSVDGIFFPQFERKQRCPVSNLYGSVLAGNTLDPSDSNTRFITPTLQSIKPRKLCETVSDVRILFDTIASFSDTPLPFEEFNAALHAAQQEQESFFHTLHQASCEALDWLKEHDRHGIILAGRPYHIDSNLSHRIDELLTDLGYAVFSYTGLSGHFAQTDFSHTNLASSSSEWRLAKSVMKAARVAVENPRLDIVYLYSFNCGYDALNLSLAKRFLAEHDRPFTALKIDDIVDHAHVKIRLRTLSEALKKRERAQTKPSNKAQLANIAVSQADQTHITSSDAPYVVASLPPLTARDIETARSCVNQEVCFVASALAGSALNLLRDQPETTHLKIPRVCSDCLLDGMSDMIRDVLGWAPEIIWKNGSKTHYFAALEEQKINTDAPAKIGILGNALFCFNDTANRNLLKKLAQLDVEVTLPPLDLLFVDDLRYLPIIESYLAAGIRDVIYLQAFGCLKGHIYARGALRDIQRRYPELRLTIIDFDHDTSILNQENRLRLAVAHAKREA